jgi:4-amino-4-deoxy-L-arabinose transferase-like glycosyltransferase
LKFIHLLLILTAAAFILRLTFCFEQAAVDNGINMVVTPLSCTDMATYMDLSKKVIEGNFAGEIDYQPFYYMVFLPVVHFFSRCLTGVLIAQSLLGAATVFLCGLASAKIWGRKAGIIAALLLLFCGPLILYTPFHLIATLQAFWFILLFLISLSAVKKNKIWLWGILGFITGCSILTRGNAWLFVPGLIFAILYPAFKLPFDLKKNLPRQILSVLLFIFMLFLSMLPFICYNSKVKGELTGPSTAGGKVLLLGNTPEAPPGSLDYTKTLFSWMAQKDKVSELERIWRWFKKEPVVLLELQFRKLLLFWDHREIPNNISWYHSKGQSNILSIGGFIPTAVIMSLALAGILLYSPKLRTKWKLALLFYFVVASWFGVSAFYILARFRVPVIPLLSVYASGTIVLAWQQIKNSKRSKLLKQTLPCILFGFLVCYLCYDIYRYNYEAAIMRLIRPNGVDVEINPDKFMFLDNGPMALGGWTLLTPATGMKIEKEFAGVDVAQFKSSHFALNIASKDAASITLRINGKETTLTLEKGDMTEKEIPFALSATNKVNIEIIKFSPEIYLLIDGQRDYGRTQIDGENANGELVCRLYCNKK